MRPGGWRLCAPLAAFFAIASAGQAVAGEDAARRGAYIFSAAGCAGCHTPKADREAKIVAAGGRALKTPFGVFFTPNITPDQETGLGGWTEGDFRRALHEGRAPDGSAYFPAFPFTSYTAMTDADVADLWAYMQTLPSVRRTNRPHDLPAPFGWRMAARLWQALFFSPGRFVADTTRPPAVNRGAYVVNALGHCGECHTPRNALGARDPSQELAGTASGPHGDKVPNITPDDDTGTGKWSDGDFESLFTLGMLPDTDFVGSGMAEVVDNTTARWTVADRKAAIAYLRAVPARRNDAVVKKKKSSLY